MQESALRGDRRGQLNLSLPPAVRSRPRRPWAFCPQRTATPRPWMCLRRPSPRKRTGRSALVASAQRSPFLLDEVHLNQIRLFAQLFRIGFRYSVGCELRFDPPASHTRQNRQDWHP